MGGVKVKLLMPMKSDSLIVDYAVRSYYAELLRAGIEIYQYTRGFVHAKTMVCDAKIAMVGTANMDIRSFDLNFEVNAIVYDREFATELQSVFYEDLKSSAKLDAEDLKKQSKLKTFFERVLRLLSPLL